MPYSEGGLLQRLSNYQNVRTPEDPGKKKELPVGQEYNGESVGCLVLLPPGPVGWVPAVCKAEDEVVSGKKRMKELCSPCRGTLHPQQQ